MEDKTVKKIEPEAIKAEFIGIWYGLTRPGTAEMMNYLEDNGFFEAPASTKYHGNYPGGLAEHSVNVYERMRQLNIEEGQNHREQPIYSNTTIAVVALLHDVCKMDAYKVKNPEKETENPQYEYTNTFPAGHGEKSVIRILQHMPLIDDEILAIRWHMGAFDYSTKGGSYDMNYAFRETKLAAMLHIADMMATHLDER